MTRKFTCKYCGGNHGHSECTRDLEARTTRLAPMRYPDLEPQEPKHTDFCVFCNDYIFAWQLEEHRKEHVDN